MKGALVTGAGLRIGRALAEALAADGFFVFVHYNRSAAGARETVAAIAAAGGRAKACLLYTSPSPRDGLLSRMPSSA